MTDNVIPVNFGAEQREAALKFARLMKLADAQAAAILADPTPFLKEAADEIGKLRREMRRMADATRRPLIQLEPLTAEQCRVRVPTVVVQKADFLRWRECDNIVRNWIEKGLV